MFSKAFIAATCLVFVLGGAGCFNSSVDEQSVPWGRPAEWESGAPGMGGGGSGF
ncbi:MAG: hypothetical protein ACLFS4_04995 [Opitutales bacterium]